MDYRSEFPILEPTTYLVSHSLGAMPRKAAERAGRVRAHVGGARDPLLGRGLVGDADGASATRSGGSSARPPGSTVMHQNVAIAEAVALSCFRPVDPARNRVVYERGNFPSVRYLYQAQPDLEVVVCEDDEEIVERIDERTLLVPISHVLFKAARDPGRRADRSPRPRGRRARDPRLLPVRRDRPARRHRARRRLRRRRLGEVALRGPRERLALRPPRPRRAARADVHGLAGARAAVRLRGGARVRARRRALPHRHAEPCGALRRHRGLRPRRGDRRRADPRELAAPDRSS